MLDIKIIRTNPELVKESIKKRNMTVDLDLFLQLDEKRNALTVEMDELRALKNKVSKEIPTIKDNDERAKKIAEMKKVGYQIYLMILRLSEKLMKRMLLSRHLWRRQNLILNRSFIMKFEKKNDGSI